MKFKTIPCPFCKTGHAHITYEENRVYQLNCPDCGSAIFRKDKSWDAAVEFFERMVISAGWIPVTERLPEDDELVLIMCKIGKMFVGYHKHLYPGRTVWRIMTARDSTKEITQKVTHWMPLPEAPKEDE